jgi:LysM repeat protein
MIEQLWVISKIVSNWADKFKKRAIDLAKDGTEFPTLRLKKMGSTKKVTDNQTLIEIAKEFGLSEKEIIEEVNLPLSKIAKAVSEKAEKGEKKKLQDKFIDQCNSVGIVEVSPLGINRNIET